MQVERISELSADIIYTTDTEDKDMITKEYLKKVNEIEALVKNISIVDGRGMQFSFWGQLCLKNEIDQKGCSE